MAFTVGTDAPSGDLVRNYSRRMGRIDSRRSNVIRGMLDRSYESEVQNAERTHIPVPTLPTSPADRTRNANWPTPSEATQEFLTLAIDRSKEDAVALEYRDAIESPLNYLELNRRSLAAGLNTAIEDDLWAFLNASGNFSSGGRSYDAGTRGTDYIAPNGDPTGNPAAEVVKHLARIQTRLVAANKMGPAAGDQIDRATRPVSAVVNPYVFEAIALYLLDEKYSLDTLTTQVLDQMSVRQATAYQGSLFGINIYSTPVSATPASAGNNNKWDCLVFSPDCATYAERDPKIQYLTPETNQTKPRYELKQIQDYGRLILDTSVLFRIRVHTN